MKNSIIITTLGLLLGGCAAQHQALQAQNAQDQILRDRISQAKNIAELTCPDKPTCDKAFALTKIYLQQNADMKVQLSDDTLISTFNPIQSGQIGLNAIKIPAAGQRSTIQITAGCKNSDYSYVLDICGHRLLAIYEGFKPFVESRLK